MEIGSVILQRQGASAGTDMFICCLKTVMFNLDIEVLYDRTSFDLHGEQSKVSSLTHREEFILSIVYECMKIKSNEIGARITEEEQGKYVRHNNKKKTHEAGQ